MKIVCPKCGSKELWIAVKGTADFSVSDLEIVEDGAHNLDLNHPSGFFSTPYDAEWHATCQKCEHEWEVSIE